MKKVEKGSPKTGKVVGGGPVRYTVQPGQNALLNVQVDFALAAVPGAYYYADCLALRYDRELAVVTLSFARTDALSGRVGDRLDVVMPAGALFLFWNSSRDVEKTLDEQLKALGVSPESRPIGVKALARTTLFANVIFVSTGGGESCLDFYYMPVRDIHFAKKNRSTIGLEPILRVLSSPVLLKNLFDLSRPYAASIGPPQTPNYGRVNVS